MRTVSVFIPGTNTGDWIVEVRFVQLIWIDFIPVLFTAIVSLGVFVIFVDQMWAVLAQTGDHGVWEVQGDLS